MTKWFDNPSKRRRSPAKRRKKAGTRRKPPKGYSSWQAWSRALRARIGKKKGGSTMARKRSKRRSTRSRRRSRARVTTTVRANPRRRRRARTVSVRRYRRRSNPPKFSVKGLMRQAQTGATDALWIIGGRTVTNAIPGVLGLNQAGAMGMGVKALAALGAGYVFGFVSPNAAKLATAAGFASIVEPFVTSLIGGLGIPGLAAYPQDSLSSYPEGDYEMLSPAGAVGVGSYPDADYAQQY